MSELNAAWKLVSSARSNATAAVRVALCLPSALWNQLLATALGTEPGLAIGIGLASGFTAPLQAHAPVVLLAALPAQREGWDRLTQWCRRGPGLRVLVLGEGGAAGAARVLRLGAWGYLDWDSNLAVLVKAVRTIQTGEMWVPRRLAFTLLQSPASHPTPALTRRELAVLTALAEGQRNKEIAGQLNITEATVKSHLNRVYRKLQLSDRLQAALYVQHHGLEPAAAAPVV